MSRAQIDQLLAAIRVLVEPLAEAVKQNDLKTDALAEKVAALRGELAGVKRVGRWPWILAALSLLVALAAMGEGELIPNILKALL